MATPLNIYGMGNPLLDISAEVDESVLAKYGLRAANAILAEEKHLPLYKELAALPNVQYIPGGATLNSIRVANWMIQSPGHTTYVGSIGTDNFGDILKSKAEQDGVAMPVQRTAEKETGTCGVLVTGKERSLVANLAAANLFKEAHLATPAVQEAIQKAGIYYSAGFFLTVSVPSILQVAKHAAEHNKIFCMNLSAPFITQVFGSQLAQCMPYVDILFGNEDEAREYGKANNLGTDNIEAIAKHIVGLPKENAKRGRIVVFTHGRDPTLVVTSEGSSTFPVEPLAESAIVDTNGAGDAFVGGFLSQLAQSKDIRTAVLAGHYAAREIICHSGCVFPATPAFHA
eukprot:TRINITY_DN981_c0_g1_i1.p1 TRINITY_DN981_c0_g1~~TRINITY_DN981_c0_g1_i1.p1  ORF type:complete len:352 (+),score=76.78 TRINITY_DN981_c0_g1_i1:28-1056(+)